MTCPHFNGTGIDGRGRPFVNCRVVPHGRITFLVPLSHDITVKKCCHGNYPECATFKKYEEATNHAK
jgi:hypothetical protein